MDYYSILGVEKNATPEDIRKAYKKKSMQHHPDRGGNEEEFKRVNEAYQTLSDAQKRGMYDHSQTAGQGGFDFQQRNGNFDDIFNTMFGQGFRQQAQRRNKDIRIVAEITLLDVLMGKDLVAQYRLGSGKMEEAKIHIPRGVDNNQSIRFGGAGDDTYPQLPRGNLIVNVRVKNDPEWRREGIELYKTIDISVFDAILGTTVEILTIDKKRLELKIPKGTQSGAVFNIQGYGLPVLNHHHRGSILAKVNTIIPKNLKDEEMTKIREVRDAVINRSE